METWIIVGMAVILLICLVGILMDWGKRSLRIKPEKDQKDYEKNGAAYYQRWRQDDPPKAVTYEPNPAAAPIASPMQNLGNTAKGLNLRCRTHGHTYKIQIGSWEGECIYCGKEKREEDWGGHIRIIRHTKSMRNTRADRYGARI